MARTGLGPNDRLADPAAKRLDGRLVAGNPSVEVGVSELNTPETKKKRRVGIAFNVGEGVVSAMHRSPLTGADARREPDE